MSARKFRDDYLHLGHRRRLVQQLREKGIRDERILDAISRVPRHWFVPQSYESLAYEDRALPIRAEQTISQPYTVAYQTMLLDTQPGYKVLEIGTGSGYQAAILGVMDLKVFTLERHNLLYRQALSLLDDGQFGDIRCFLRDGFLGLPQFAPFDAILVTAAAEQVPETLLQQLAIGGKMVIPVGSAEQTMQRIIRISEDIYHTDHFGQFRFVPFVGGVVHKS